MDERIIRVLRGDASEIEVRQVERWRAESGIHEREYEETAHVWSATERDRSWPTSPGGAFLRSVAEDRRRKSGARAERRALIRSPLVGYGVAAAVVVLAFLGLARAGDRSGVGLLAPVGSTTLEGGLSTLALTDGSTVRLARGGRVSFPNLPDRREVVLDGRAFFAVAEAASPFVVRGDVGQVTVHGTRFEVIATDDSVRVVVVEGIVTVDNDLGSVRVTEGQVVRVVPSSAPQVSDLADVWSLLEWPNGLLVFQATPLRMVAAELERHFGVRMEVDPELAGRRVTGWFDEEDVMEVVDGVCLIVGARCEVGTSLVTFAR